MLTLPVETLTIEAVPGTRPQARVLIVGRSENVLSETVEILRSAGHAAGATNQFADVMDLFDLTAVDIVVFGGMVPPDTKELLRGQISGRNPAITFIQGLAGIAGLIAAQVQASLTGDARARTGLAVSYDRPTRTVRLHLDQPEDVQVTAWWATSFTPPEPRSTSQVVLAARLPAGPHTVTLPGEVPAQASFVSVTAGDAVQALTVGPMPQLALLPVPQSPPAPLADGAGVRAAAGVDAERDDARGNGEAARGPRQGECAGKPDRRLDDQAANPVRLFTFGVPSV